MQFPSKPSKKLFRNKKILLLTGIMVAVTILIAIISVLLIYNQAQKGMYDRLTDIVNREKSQIEVLLKSYHFSENDLITHYSLIQKSGRKLGTYGEINLGYRAGDSIVFYKFEDSTNYRIKIPNDIPMSSMMQRALNNESGMMKGVDYTNTQVFAAYAPVEDLKWGIVAKIPTHEIYAPFINAIFVVFVLSLIFISVCVYLFLRISNPLVNSIIENEQKLILFNEKLLDTNSKLKESKMQLELAIKVSPLPIMLHCVDGEVLLLNDAWTKLSGYTLSDVPNLTVWNQKAFGDKDRIGLANFSGNLPEGFKIELGEYEVTTAANKTIIWDFGAASLGEFSDGRKQIITIATDVTERKLAELDLIEKNKEIQIQNEEVQAQNEEFQAQNEEFQQVNEELNQSNEKLTKALNKAEESDRLKSAFLANMSHEIRTPMNGILGFSELLKEPNLSSKEQKKYIEIIEKSGKRMLNTISDIIDISKIEAGLVELVESPTNINTQIDDIFDFFYPEATKKGLKLMSHQPLPFKEANITTDSEKLYAILSNLVKNALKYTEKGSIEFGYVLKDKMLQFYVTDTGIGIPIDRQQAIFERFVQADIEDVNAYQGSGLGLSIAKAYVEMLGGKIWVKSIAKSADDNVEHASGSTFYFTLPYYYETVADEAIQEIETMNEANEENNYTFLIVEDDPNSEILLSISLKKYCKDCIIARNGKKAIEICKNSPNIDLIFMDIKLPEMDGYEVTRQIRAFNKDVIIIAQTAHALIGDANKAYIAGCNDYISKPISRTDLVRVMNKYLKKK